jgi:hypothetical protein
VEGRLFEVSQQVGLDPERVDRSITLHTAGNVVEVTIPIAPKEATRELLQLPVYYEHGDILTVERKRVVRATESLDLEVRGPRSLLDSRTNEQLRSSIRLVYDWADSPVSPRLDQARARVRVLRDLDLPDEIKIVGLDGRHPEIEYRLEDLEPAAPPPAKDGSP